jgi:transposase-like protein
MGRVVAWQDGWVKVKTIPFSAVRRRRTPREKAAILKDYERSGLSLLAFAGQHGLCYASLLRWRRRQGGEISVTAPPDCGPGPRFIPVEIEEEALGGDYVLSWPGGASLKIPRRFDPDSLRRLLAVLEVMR